MKYKHAEAEGWYCTIDDNGNKSQSWNEKNRPVCYEEMQAWVKAGNVIEPQFTVKELKQKKADDLQKALDSQKSTCIQLLNDSEKAVSNDPPYPDDTTKWKTFRGKLRTILKSDALVTIPNKPF